MSSIEDEPFANIYGGPKCLHCQYDNYNKIRKCKNKELRIKIEIIKPYLNISYSYWPKNSELTYFRANLDDLVDNCYESVHLYLDSAYNDTKYLNVLIRDGAKVYKEINNIPNETVPSKPEVPVVYYGDSDIPNWIKAIQLELN